MLDKYEKYAPFFLRISVGFIWFLFGIDKIINPMKLAGYVPMLPIPKETVLLMLAVAEMIIGAFLLVGFLTRLSALASALLLIPIIITVFPTNLEIAIRDIGWFLASVALLLMKQQIFSVDGLMGRSG